MSFGYNSNMKGLILGLVVVTTLLNASWRGGEDFKSPSVPLYEWGKSSLLPALAGDHPLTPLPPLAGGTKGGGRR